MYECLYLPTCKEGMFRVPVFGINVSWISAIAGWKGEASQPVVQELHYTMIEECNFLLMKRACLASTLWHMGMNPGSSTVVQ